MRRSVAGTAVAFAGIAVLSAIMLPLRAHLSATAPALVLVLPVVGGVAVGGLGSGAPAVAAGFVAYDVLFIPPYGTFNVGAAQNWVALVVYVVAMLIVARVVAFLQKARTEARRHEDATRRLYVLSDLLIGDQPVPGVLQLIVTTIQQVFGARWAVVMLPGSEGGHQTGPMPSVRPGLAIAATAGAPLSQDELALLAPEPGRPESLRLGRRGETIARVALSARDRPVGLVAMAGPTLDRHDNELLQTYANQAALALERSQLREQALRTELLEEVNRLRAAMMGAVSHDLRTPLASVKAAVTALRRASDGPLTPGDRAELLELIEHQADALDRLVANLLDVTRIQSGALELRRDICPVTEVVDGALATGAAAPGSVVVTLPADLPPVDVDQVLMQQVVANLLDNAARYSPDGHPIEVTAIRHNGTVELAVADHGPGVPAAERDRVFQLFNRVSGGGRAGLGLAIAKAFVDAHGQSIRVDDTPGGGARFVVTMPSAAPEPPSGR